MKTFTKNAPLLLAIVLLLFVAYFATSKLPDRSLIEFLVLIVALSGIIYISAKNRWQLAFVPTGDILIITAFGDVVKVIVNVDGQMYDDPKDVIRAVKEGELDGPSQFSWLAKKYGIHLVSFLFPFVRVHGYQFEWDKLTGKITPDGLTKYGAEHRNEWVESLRWKYTYPITATDIDLQGNMLLKEVEVRLTLMAVRPITLLFLMTKGQWMPSAVKDVRSLIIEYSKDRDLDKFRADAPGESSKENSLAAFLVNKQLLKPGHNELGALLIVGATLANWTLSTEDPEIVKASTEKKLAEIHGDAEIIKEEKGKIAAIKKAEGISGAITLEGNAKAAVVGKIRESLGGDSDATARIFKAQAIEETELTTFVEGGGNAGVVLTAPPKKEGQ